MLHHHPQLRMPATHRVEHLVDKHCFAIKDVYIRIGYLTVHTQWQIDLGHLIEHRIDACHVSYTGVGIRSGASGVELDRLHQARLRCLRHILSTRRLG